MCHTVIIESFFCHEMILYYRNGTCFNIFEQQDGQRFLPASVFKISISRNKNIAFLIYL